MNPAVRHKYPNRKRRLRRLCAVASLTALLFACAAGIVFVLARHEAVPAPEADAQKPSAAAAARGALQNALRAPPARSTPRSIEDGKRSPAADAAAPAPQNSAETGAPSATEREVRAALGELARDSGIPAPFAGYTVEESAAILAKRYAVKPPSAWGEHLPGVTSSLAPGTEKRAVVALTLDACGGKKGASYDAGLIALLRERNIPATLFVTSLWMRTNPEALGDLAADPLFEIAAHGSRHRPCSVNGKTVYGIKGTASFAELAAEVEGNARDIEKATGKRPRWFRAGTAYYDDVAVRVIHDLGLSIAGYSIAGDQGATLPAAKVAANVRAARNGDIVLLHMNKPQSGAREGLRQALPELLERGVTFIRLSDVR